MKPPRFRYLAPSTQAEVLNCLAEYGDEAKLLAGGQSLVPLLNFRLAHPAVLIDLNGAAGLDALAFDADTDELVFGPMVRQSDAERSPLARERGPLLVEALRHVGHRAIRNRGTVGGSLAHADPSAELPLVLTALGGRVTVASRSGERTVAAADFFVSYLTTALKPDELLVEARFPVRDAWASNWGFAEFSRRHGDFALAAAAVGLDLDNDGRVADAAIGVAGGGPTPIRAPDVARGLCGRRLDAPVAREAAAAVADACEVEPDLHASAAFRRKLIAVQVERALMQAAGRDGLGEDGADGRIG